MTDCHGRSARKADPDFYSFFGDLHSDGHLRRKGLGFFATLIRLDVVDISKQTIITVCTGYAMTINSIAEHILSIDHGLESVVHNGRCDTVSLMTYLSQTSRLKIH